MNEWSQSRLNRIFHEACVNCKTKTVEALLELGADPFSEDEQGVAAVTKAALSNIELRLKIISVKNSYTVQVKRNYVKLLNTSYYVKVAKMYIMHQP